MLRGGLVIVSSAAAPLLPLRSRGKFSLIAFGNDETTLFEVEMMNIYGMWGFNIQ